MSLENYQGLVDSLNGYNNLISNDSKKYEVSLAFFGDQVEFKTVSESR
jgi:hypothetical protein